VQRFNELQQCRQNADADDSNGVFARLREILQALCHEAVIRIGHNRIKSEDQNAAERPQQAGEHIGRDHVGNCQRKAEAEIGQSRDAALVGEVDAAQVHGHFLA